MERARPVLAADDHPPSPPPPPTPAPPSEPRTPADNPTPAEHSIARPESPSPSQQSRPVRRSARIRAESDPSADRSPEPAPSTRNGAARKHLKRVSTDDATGGSGNESPEPEDDVARENTTRTTSPPELDRPEESDGENIHADVTGDGDPAPQPSDPDREDDESSKPRVDGDDEAHDGNDVTDGEKHISESGEDADEGVNDSEVMTRDRPDAEDDEIGDNDGANRPETTKDASGGDAGKDKPNMHDGTMDDDEDMPAAPAMSNDGPSAEAEDDDTENDQATPDDGDDIESRKKALDKERTSPLAEKPETAGDAMDVDHTEPRSDQVRDQEDDAMDVEGPAKPIESTENPAESFEAQNEDASNKKSAGDAPPAVTDTDDDIQQNVAEISKPRSPPPFSPPLTRRRLATRTSFSPESPRITTRASIDTPKTAPHHSTRRSESSDEVVAIEKAATSRYETRSSTRGPSPARTRRRRHSEPAPVVAPSPKPRTRRTKRYSRKPVKGDRLCVLWHIDNIYYEGVVDSVLAFRGKRFYDITYDSGEREYYLELTHRRWRFADGRDGDLHDEEEDDNIPVQKDTDYSKYPQIGDRILVMWHVDGKYYPGKVNDILKANGAWYYDVDYEGGDREFFLDLTIRKWKYPETSEESGKDPLLDRKMPKQQAKPKPKPKVKPKPKPKRVARKTIGPGSSSFGGEGSLSQSPPRPSRRQRTLEMLLDDQDGIEGDLQQEEIGKTPARGSRSDEVVGVLEGTNSGLPEKEPMDSDVLRKQHKSVAPVPTPRETEPDRIGGTLDAIFDGFGGDDMDVMDEMEPPLLSQTVLKRPRASRASEIGDVRESEPKKPKENEKGRDMFGELLRKPPLPIPGSGSEPFSPTSAPKSQSGSQHTREEETENVPKSLRSSSPPRSQLASASKTPRVEHSSATNGRSNADIIQSILKRKPAEKRYSAPVSNRQAPTRNQPVSAPLLPQRRLRTIERPQAAEEGLKEVPKTGDDPNVAEIVSVAGIVAKKWAREEVARISGGIDKLKKQISSLKVSHAKSLASKKHKQRAADPHTGVLPDDEAERQINNLGTNIVALVRKYRDTVEEREKKLKMQFTKVRAKITKQNEGLMETADVLSKLDIKGLEALKGLQPRIRKKLEIPPPLPSRQPSQAYTHPPAYALSSGVPMQQYQGSQGSPGTLGQQNDAVVRNLRRRLADLVTRSEWLGDEVKRLQGREKSLFREKAAALAELRKAKRNSTVVDLTSNGKGKIIRPSSRSSLPPTKPGPTKLVGITKRRTRATATSSAPSTPLSKGSGKALRKTLPRNNSKYKAPSPQSQSRIPQNQAAAMVKAGVQAAPVRSSTAAAPISTSPAKLQAAHPDGVASAVAAKPREVPSALQVQMNKQASDLISLTFTVWLLQDESRSEPPSGPGDGMDTWVRGCVKKCLNSALAFLTACGGIFRARSTLKADVDNENIYTDWIMSAPTDDAAIERARANYSLWDPSLRDSEWQAEKRVLRGLTICFQKALALTPAASFDATLMYAKAILNKAIADFETFMPATITVLPGKRTTLPPTIPSGVAKPSSTVPTSAQSRPTSATPLSDLNNTQSASRNGAKAGKVVPQGQAKSMAGSRLPPSAKQALTPAPLKGGGASNSLPLGAGSKPAQNVPNSAGTIQSSAASVPPNPSGEVSTKASTPVPPAGGLAPSAPVSEKTRAESINIAKQPDPETQARGLSQLGATSKDRSRLQPSALPVSQMQATPSAAELNPKGTSVSQPSKQTNAASQTLQPPMAANNQVGSVPSQKSGSATGGNALSRRDRNDTTALDPVKTGIHGQQAAKGGRDPPPSGGSDVANTGPRASTSGGGAKVTVLQDAADQPPIGDAKKPQSHGKPANSSKQAEPGSKSLGKVTAQGSTAKSSQGQKATAKTLLPAADRVPAKSIPQSTSEPGVDVPRSGAATQQSTRAVQPSLSQPRPGTSSSTPHTAPRGARSVSKLQSRVQTRTQKRNSSSGQSKASRTHGVKKQTNQATVDVVTTQSPIVASSELHSQAELSTTRLQEIPRKHILGAARAPLELPRTTPSLGQAGDGGLSGASRSAESPTHRTYPMLSRNQVRVTTPAMSSAPMPSRNQVVPGKRPLGTAQMSVPAAPQRRAAPGMQPSGAYGSTDGGDKMEVDTGRDLGRRRSDMGAGMTEFDIDGRRRSGVGNDISSPTRPHSTGLPDDSDNVTTPMYTSSPPLNVLGHHQIQGNVFQSTGKKKIGFKSLPMAPPRQPSHTGTISGAAGALSNVGTQDRVPQNSLEAQRPLSGQMEYTRTSEAQASEYPYGQGGEPVYSPYNAGQDRDLPVDLMNPPTPSSFAGLDGYPISLNADQVNLQRDSLPATPSDFDRYGVQSPINLERQSSYDMLGRGSHSQQSQGQLGHIMNPQRRDGGFSQPQPQLQPQQQRYQTRGNTQGRR